MKRVLIIGEDNKEYIRRREELKKLIDESYIGIKQEPILDIKFEENNNEQT